MKVIKLNRRYKQYKEHRHTVGVKFNGWDQRTTALEKALRNLTEECYGWDPAGEWFSWFGKVPQKGSRPYFITVRNEELLTMALMTMENTE